MSAIVAWRKPRQEVKRNVKERSAICVRFLKVRAFLVVPTGLELESPKIDDTAQEPDVIDISKLKWAKG